MVCDVLFVVLLGAAVALGYRAVADDLDVQTWLQVGVPFVGRGAVRAGARPHRR